MSFEQADNERRYREDEKNKEKQKQEEFWAEKEIYRESSELLNKLASEISHEFWIDLNEAKRLISWDINDDLSVLKNNITGNNIDSNKLQWAISKAKSQIEDLSKKHRENLKNSLDRGSYTPEKHNYTSSRKIFSEELVNRAKNPKNYKDQIIWFAIGCIDSGEAVIIYSYEFSKWILLSPYHVYLLLSWKWEYKDFSDI